MAVIDDIAERAGVSRDTAARILRGECKGIRRDAVMRAELVKDIARSIGYRPNAAAKAVSSGVFNSITLMDDHDIRMHYLPSSLLDSIGSSLSQRGIRLTYSSFSEKSHSSFSLVGSLFHEKHCDGYLLNYLKPVPEDFLIWSKVHDIKCVWLNNRTGSHCVHMDDRKAGHGSAELLCDAGHCRIAYLGPDPSEPLAHSSVPDRHFGFKSALCSTGNVGNLERFCGGGEEAFEVARDMLSKPGRPTAVVAYESYYAIPALTAALSLNLKVPEDVSIVCISDHPVTECGVPIETMVLDARRMGVAAVDMLLAFIGGEKTEDQVAIEPDRFNGQTLGQARP